MSNKKNIIKEIDAFQRLDENPANLDAQLDDLMELLAKSDLDSTKAKLMRDRFEQAVNNATLNHKNVKAFESLDQLENVSRAEMLDNMEVLLSKHELNSKQSTRYLLRIRMKKVIMSVISVLLITLGFAMIIMPAPPYFEMFTIFYFTQNDGVTLMDLISLLIVLSGIYLLIRTLFFEPQQNY